MPGGRPEIIAHRGAGYGWKQPDAPPENTLPAFRWAWSAAVNADAVELDVQLTRDGELVVIHDATLRRTTDGRGTVRAHTLRELRRLDAGSWKSEAYAGTPVPLLEEAIATVPRGKRLLIEIKCGPEGVPRLASLVRACGKRPAQIGVLSFDRRAIALAKREMPDHECYLVTAFRGRFAFADLLIRGLRRAGLDGVDVRYPVSRRLLERFAACGLKTLVWTVNSAAGASRMARFGVGGITTDFPAEIRAAVAGAAGRGERERW